ncbi:GNAT family N-acetyltransferase [Gryllotalpicola reticulitermitis]|uniref:GNAT family N-acetyltransferase n=1 Tax=Gryllotalpicola reticulitermitis TaxID=1184153 RepID=A0ABV8Q3K2_9MICO
MTIAIREPRDSDFFPWLSLYEAYTAARGAALTEQKALLLWTWLSDPAHVESALIAVDDEGEVLGLAHFHTFPRPLEGDSGTFVDALYVGAEVRDETVGTRLFDAIRDYATGHGAGVLRWTKGHDEQLPAALTNAGAEASSPEVHELQLTAQRVAQPA